MKSFHHICIQTNNYEASKAFYVDLLDFKVIKETENFHNRAYNTWLKLDGMMIELQTGKNQIHFNAFDKEREGIPHFCLLVNDINAVYEHLIDCGFTNFKKKDGSVIYRVENCNLMKIAAPEGTIIEFRDQYNL